MRGDGEAQGARVSGGELRPPEEWAGVGGGEKGGGRLSHRSGVGKAEKFEVSQ